MHHRLIARDKVVHFFLEDGREMTLNFVSVFLGPPQFDPS
jgi:hypothetical protein